ncbi:hypothetical protein PG988_007163 [Apiospora saccharicola]
MSGKTWKDSNYISPSAEFVKEWRSDDNSWAMGKKWGPEAICAKLRERKRHKYAGLRSGEPGTDESARHEEVIDRLARGQKPLKGLGGDEVPTRLLEKRNHCSLAFELAGVYVPKN